MRCPKCGSDNFYVSFGHVGIDIEHLTGETKTIVLDVDLDYAECKNCGCVFEDSHELIDKLRDYVYLTADVDYYED